MSVLIDPPSWPAHGRLWSHLVSDTSYPELQAFARANDIPVRGFEGDHYDVPQERYEALVRAGAQPVSGTELARRLRASGLRFAKRRGERPLGRFTDALPGIGVDHVLDLVASDLPTPPASTDAAAVFVSDAGGRLLLVHSVARDAWGAPAGGREDGESPRECAVREVLEEAGLRLHPAQVVECGYERITFTGGRPVGRWRHARSYVACYRAVLESSAPTVAPLADDVTRAVWASPRAAATLCQAEFWWPLVTHLGLMDAP